MRYIKLLLVLWCCCSGLAYGQRFPFKWKKWTAPKASASSRSAVSNRQLNERVLQTYRRAKSVQNLYPLIEAWGGPSKHFAARTSLQQVEEEHLNALTPTLLYPNSSFLSSNQLSQCFLVQHNLELIKWVPKQDQLRQYIETKGPFLQQHQVKVDQPAQQDMMAWLARQVTPETRHLLIGEIHDPGIGRFIPRLLSQLRQSQPQRPIFLFTEFLPEGQIWGRPEPGLRYFPDQVYIWEAANAQQIPVVGLEPEFTYEANPRLMERDPNERGHAALGSSMWASVAGVRLRNQYWFQVLADYRAQYPDALFVVYSGNAHVDYTEPYSLGSKLANQNTLVALLFPEQFQHVSTGETTYLTSKFDAWTNGQFLDRIVQFDLPEVSQLVGFDIRIRIPGLVSKTK